MIAISYRREDSLPIAGRLYDRLQADFGKGNVFMDFDSIPYGVDFREHIKQMIERSKLVIAIIGPDWLGQRRGKTRRIDDPADFVRLEIAYALERGVPVIPVLINKTPMPKAGQLPTEIEGLAFRNAVTLDAGIDFHHHADRLVVGIHRLVTEAEKAAAIQKTVTPRGAARIEMPLAPALFQKPDATEGPTHTPKMSPAVPQRPAISGHSKSIPGLLPTSPQKASAPEPSKPAHQTRIPRVPFPKSLWIAALPKRAVAIGTAALVATMTATAIFYFGFHRPRELAREAERESFARAAMKLRERELAKVEPPAVSSVPGTTLPGSPTVTPSPTTAISFGTLEINSNPQGHSYELIDPSGKHRTGMTPVVLNDVPVGYSQVIYKKEGFPDHSEAVWVRSGDKSSSITWTFPSQPVTTGPLSRNNRTWQAWIGEFVKQFVMANQLQDVNANLVFYASNVDYFDDHQKDQAYIRRDIEKYNERWPVRHDSIEGDIRLQEKIPNRLYLASFKLNFYAESAARAEWSRGQFAIDLDIYVRDVDGMPEISGIKEKVLRQQKGPLKVIAASPSATSGMQKSPPSASPMPGVPSNQAIAQKLVRVSVKKYGISVLLPPSVFPDFEKLSNGIDASLNENGTNVMFYESQKSLRQTFEDHINGRAAETNQKIDYKILKETWFVVSGISGGSGQQAGFYTKGVKRGKGVVVMRLLYHEEDSPISDEILTAISRSFDGH